MLVVKFGECSITEYRLQFFTYGAIGIIVFYKHQFILFCGLFKCCLQGGLKIYALCIGIYSTV